MKKVNFNSYVPEFLYSLNSDKKILTLLSYIISSPTFLVPFSKDRSLYNSYPQGGRTWSVRGRVTQSAHLIAREAHLDLHCFHLSTTFKKS